MITILLVATWIICAFSTISITRPRGQISVGGGVLGLTMFHGSQADREARFQQVHQGAGFYFNIYPITPEFGFIWPITLDDRVPQIPNPPTWTSMVVIPLWIPVFVMALPTGWLWLRRRRSTGGCTNCGYDLTGNISGTCPECGRAIAAKPAPANGENAPERSPASRPGSDA